MENLSTPAPDCAHASQAEIRELHPAIAHTLIQISAARRTIESGLRTLNEAMELERIAGTARILDAPPVTDAPNVVRFDRTRKPARTPAPAVKASESAPAPKPTGPALVLSNPEPPRRRRAR